MKYIIRKLELNRPISLPDGKPAADGTCAIHECRSLVSINDLEPSPADHLAGDTAVTEIPPGNYLFTQGCDAEDRTAWRDAAEAVWLESLWQEAEFKTDSILVRVLSEDSKTVFQIFREVVKKD